MRVVELLEELHLKELELRSLNYGSVEKRGKYLYSHYKLDGDNYTYYIGEYTDDAYNHAIEDNIKAKELKKDIRRIKRDLNSYGFMEKELSEDVLRNIDFAKRNLAITIYKQAVLEGINTTEIETENIIEGLKVKNMTADDIMKIVNLKHAWDFILDENVISTETNYSILCIVNKLVLEGFTRRAGRLRDVPVSISGTSWVPGFPFESDIKDDITTIMNKRISDHNKAIELLLYVTKKQMFLDGNKRCAVILANHYLISKGKGLIVIPADKTEEYKILLLEYYETDKTSKIKEFLKKCIISI